MQKYYRNKRITTKNEKTREYMFPNANGGPRTIRARSRKEAEKKLKADNSSDV